VRWLRRLRRADRRSLDRGLAALFVVAGEVELLLVWPGGDQLPVFMLVLALAYGALAWRRSHPLQTAAFILGAWIFGNLFLIEVEPLQLPIVSGLLASYSVGANTDGRRAVAGPVLLLAGILGVVATFEDNVLGDVVFPPTFVMVAWLAGRGLRTRTRLTEELHEAAVRAQEAHEEEAARAAADERRRIAREMHDVVAHSVSVMVVQAGGARRILARDPARAAEAAAHIEDVGRAALAEMRRLLGVLHQGEDEGARAPQPTLRELGALVERSRAAGLPVALTVHGDPRPLPAGKDLAAYRVVQEALTNAMKHAGAAPTDVDVRWEADHLELQIVDRGAPAKEVNGSGHGLVGMEERMRLYDGELRAGPRAGGGFEVIARLPL